MPLEARVVGAEEFAGMRAEWNALLARSASDNVFLRWEWMHAWWEVFGAGRRLFIVAAREGARLVGVAPFYVEEQGPGLRHLKFCSDELYPDALDVFAERGREREFMEAAWGQVDASSSLWDTALFNHMRADSLLFTHAPALGDYRWVRRASEKAPYILIEGSYENYLSDRRKLASFSLAKKEKRLMEEKGLSYRVLGASGLVSSGLEDLFRLHDLRAREKGISTRFTSPEVKRFHFALGRLLLQEGIVSLRALYEGERAVSSLYCFDYGGKISVYQSGFDPSWNRWSVGMVLFGIVVREAFDGGRREFDFLKGSESYKELWTDDFRQESSMIVFNKGLRGSWDFLRDRFKSVLRGARSLLPRYPSAWRPASSSLK
jgi:CelD/BcsL family acetyltransferase involved in cellulose biosynthesis